MQSCLTQPGYNGEDLLKMLLSFQEANIATLDRWRLVFEQTNKEVRICICFISASEACGVLSPSFFTVSLTDGQESSDPVPLSIANNYFSIGVDASIALRFHNEREANPRKFTSRSLAVPIGLMVHVWLAFDLLDGFVCIALGVSDLM